MKITLITLGATILFAIGSITTISYADAGHQQAEKHESHHQQQKKGDHVEEGGHMGRMNEIMQKLKSELGEKYNHPVPAATKDQLAAGEKIFTKSCAVCHGQSGKGDGPAAVGFKQKPADFTDPEHSRLYSDQGRIHIIKKGIPETPMPSWEGILNDQQIQSVHAYIRSLRTPVNKDKHGQDVHSH